MNAFGLRLWRGVAAVAAGLGLLASAPRARGAGLLVADGGWGGALEITEHDVQVTINNGIAVTRVTQVFKNLENRQVEALYTFPVPRGASVANFSMWIGGKEMTGEVLEKERAREIYNSYKQKRQDPGLLEQKDYKTFELRVFPIGPHAEQKIQIAYYQELDSDADWATYVYPLATVTRPDIKAAVSGRFAINLEIKTAVPIAELASPSHGEQFVTVLHSPQLAQASLEARDGTLERDVVLACRTERPHTGLDLITSKDADGDGFFQLTLTAGADLEALDERMDYAFVLDVSGSMQHDGKIGISRDAVAAFAAALEPGDRFEALAFNVTPAPLFGGLRAVGPEPVAALRDFLWQQRARGGTVLHAALQAAYACADPDRVLNVVLLSDGLTEAGEQRTLRELLRARPRNVRVFCVGVGNDVNRPLLEEIAGESGGLAAFLSPGDNFERQARAFRRKLIKPVATDLAVDFGDLKVYDLEPAVLPPLYHGAPVRLYGRYRGGATPTLTLTSKVREQTVTQRAALAFPERDAANPEIERMWALKRVDRLLKRADREGDRAPVRDEIVRLGEAYSIVTEYTSFLVLENDAEYQRWKIERRNERRMGRDRAAQAERERLNALARRKAAVELGPQAAAAQPVAPQPATPGAQPAPTRNVPAAQPARTTPAPHRSVDFNFGAGPVGPLFLLVTGWLARRRRGNG